MLLDPVFQGSGQVIAEQLFSFHFGYTHFYEYLVNTPRTGATISDSKSLPDGDFVSIWEAKCYICRTTFGMSLLNECNFYYVVKLQLVNNFLSVACGSASIDDDFICVHRVFLQIIIFALSKMMRDEKRKLVYVCIYIFYHILEP